MRYPASTLIVAAAFLPAIAGEALAQHVRFERTFDVSSDIVLDVSTIRGKIDVSVGEPNRVVVRGTATVRWGVNVPTEAWELAKKVAGNPPIRRDGNAIRLRPPASDDERRAMTISYQVLVPQGAHVTTVSGSGATVISGVAGHVAVQTQSGAIELRDLSGSADVTGSSGAVRVDDVAGDLSVRTQSGAIALRSVGAGLRVRTQSGAVDVSFSGQGLVDVETASSSIDLAGVRGGLLATSRSGRIRVAGTPTAPWQISSGSGSFDVALDRLVGLDLDVTSGSGSVRLDGIDLTGRTSKGVATGTIAGGGPLVKATSRSGSITISHR